LRATALAQTIQYGHLKLLTIYGLTNEGMRRYEDLARLAQNTRKVDPKSGRYLLLPWMPLANREY